MSLGAVGETLRGQLGELPREAETAIAVAALSLYVIGHSLVSGSAIGQKAPLVALVALLLVAQTQAAESLDVPARPFRVVLLGMLALRGAVVVAPL